MSARERSRVPVELRAETITDAHRQFRTIVSWRQRELAFLHVEIVAAYHHVLIVTVRTRPCAAWPVIPVCGKGAPIR